MVSPAVQGHVICVFYKPGTQQPLDNIVMTKDILSLKNIFPVQSEAFK